MLGKLSADCVSFRAGEIDMERSRVFTSCLRREARDQRRQAMNQPSGHDQARADRDPDEEGEDESAEAENAILEGELLAEAETLESL